MVRTCTSKAGAPPRCGWPGPCAHSTTSHPSPRRRHCDLAESIMTPPILEVFNEHHEVDFAYSLPVPVDFVSMPTISGHRSPWPCAECVPRQLPPASWDFPRWSTAGRGDAWAGPGHRSDRVGQDDHVGGHGQPHQHTCDRATSSPSRIRSSICTTTIWPPSTNVRSDSTPTHSPLPCEWS